MLKPNQTSGPDSGAQLKISKAIRADLERRHWVRFWGQRRMCSPVFIEEFLGDGGKLLAVQPLNTRPNYYLIRIDSKWHTSNYEDPCVGDHMDEIYDAIENAVGPSSWQDDNEKWHHDDWPSLSDDSGSSWWDATDDLPKRRKKTA
jgi:hypothetical protein